MKNETDQLNILHERAINLAAQTDLKNKDGHYVDVIQFFLNNEKYGVEASRVLRVSDANKIAYVPCVPEYIEGVINLHGKMICVINLKKYFGLDNTERTDASKVIIISNQKSDMGLIVDHISDISKRDLQTIQAEIPTLSAVNAAYLRGITTDQVIILDADKLLNSDKLCVNDNV